MLPFHQITKKEFTKKLNFIIELEESEDAKDLKKIFDEIFKNNEPNKQFTVATFLERINIRDSSLKQFIGRAFLNILSQKYLLDPEGEPKVIKTEDGDISLDTDSFNDTQQQIRNDNNILLNILKDRLDNLLATRID